jgi:hypothetical protein
VNLESSLPGNRSLTLLRPPENANSAQVDGRRFISFPPLATVSSLTINLQSQLTIRGFLATHNESYSSTEETALIAAHGRVSDFVQSTIFWEPPISSGSDLLKTLRLKGWKPFYFRMSGGSSRSEIPIRHFKDG